MYDKSKRKIRGWKRHVRKIGRWKNKVFDIDMAHLSNYHRDYAKLWIHPFYALPRRNPPLWYNRLLLEAMLEVYSEWHKQISNANTPFYLKIWLYDPQFIHSQIVAAYKDSEDFYADTFDESTEDRSFPYYKFPSLRSKLEWLDWRLHIDSDVYAESDLSDNLQRGWMSAKEYEAIKRKAYKVTAITIADGNSEQIYSVKAGDVWIGSLKT